MPTPVLGPYRTHARRGEGFSSLLIVLVLILVCSMFVWQHFLKNRALIMAGKQCVAMREYNQGADLEYRRHFRERNKSNAQSLRTETSRFVAATLAGKYDSNRTGFEQKYDEEIAQLLDSIQTLDLNQVPKQFWASHVTLATSHRPLYESVELLKAGLAEEGAERSKFYGEAKRSLKEGLALSYKGEEGIRAQLGVWSGR